jgi:hypothetical protein
MRGRHHIKGELCKEDDTTRESSNTHEIIAQENRGDRMLEGKRMGVYSQCN